MGRLTLKGVLLRSAAEPANTPLVEQARLYWRSGEKRGNAGYGTYVLGGLVETVS